jgi:hypothetical protein
VQRRAAICAKFRMYLIRAQPRAARHAFRVDALHSPAGKILHRRLQNFSVQPPGKVGRILRHGACCVKKKTTISSGYVARQKTADRTALVLRDFLRRPNLFGRV